MRGRVRGRSPVRPGAAGGAGDELLAAERELSAANADLRVALAEAALDVAGVVDPTPISDAASAALALSRADYVGAGLSAVSMVPYLGDALGKTTKGARMAKRLKKLRERVAAATARVNEARAAKAARTASRGKGMAGAAKKPGRGPCIDCIAKKVPRAAIRPWPTDRARKILAELDQLSKPPKTAAKAHRKRLLSEQLGNEAAKQHLRRRLGRNIPDNGPGGFQEFGRGPHKVDLMYKDPDSGKIYVLEAKGGNSSALGTRMQRNPRTGKTLEQGSSEYLEDVAGSMARSSDKKTREAGLDILDAHARGDVEYIGVRGGYDSPAASARPQQPKQIFP